jgi:hypothetical protein
MLCFTGVLSGNYYEIPVDGNLTDEEKQEAVDDAVESGLAHLIFEENVSDKFTENFKDEVYMNGEIKRIDYSCDRPEAMEQINRLVEAFPEYTVEQLTASSENVIGNYGNYRPPYNNDSISFYDFRTPDVATLIKYGASMSTYMDYNDDYLLGWHGIKHDLVTGKKQAKFVFGQGDEDYDRKFVRNLPPQIPTKNRYRFFAKLHNEDGTVEPWVDCYFVSTINWMRDWCDMMGLTFPLPDDVTKQPWCFSVVWNEDTGEIDCVKAYLRHRYED